MNDIENGVVARAHDGIYNNYWGIHSCDDEDEPQCCTECGKVMSLDDRAFYEDTCEKCMLEQDELEAHRESAKNIVEQKEL